MTEPRDIIVIGGSAGAIEAVSALVSYLPANLEAALFVVIHTYPVGDSLLPRILSRRGSLSAAVGADGEPIICGRVYVAPPDLHLLIEPGRVRLSGRPKENGHRPAIDPLFCSAAQAYGERVIGVILSGALDDGSVGLRVIHRHGGSAMVQDPTEAHFRQMPANAIEIGYPQHVAPVAELARLITNHARRSDDTPGTPSGIACPECHGARFADRAGAADLHADRMEAMLLDWTAEAAAH